MGSIKQQEIAGVFEGPIMAVTLKIGLPIVISELLSFVYIIIDTYFIAGIDPQSSALLAGTGLLFPILFIFTALAAGLGIGLTVITGRMMGEKRLNETASLAASATLLALLLGIPLVLILLLSGETLIQLLAGSQFSAQAIAYGLEYLYALAPGLAVMPLLHAYGGILQGQGLTQVSAFAMLIMTLLNMALTPVFISGMGLGVAGAGLATSLSVFCALGYVLWYIHKGHSAVPVSFRFSLMSKSIMRQVAQVGLPQFLIAMSFSLTVIVFNKFVSNISENAMNAWTLVSRIDQLLLIPLVAIGGATMVLTSQNYGRQQLIRVREIFYVNAAIAMVFCVLLAVAYIALAPWIFAHFSMIPEVIDLAITQVRIIALTTACIGFALIGVASFQATGRALPAVAIVYIKMLATILIGVLLFWKVGLTMDSVFIAIAAGNILLMPLTFFWVRKHLNTLVFNPLR